MTEKIEWHMQNDEFVYTVCVCVWILWGKEKIIEMYKCMKCVSSMTWTLIIIGIGQQQQQRDRALLTTIRSLWNRNQDLNTGMCHEIKIPSVDNLFLFWRNKNTHTLLRVCSRVPWECLRFAEVYSYQHTHTYIMRTHVHINGRSN